MTTLTKEQLLQSCRLRRQALLDQMQPNSIAVIPSAMPALRNNDVFYEFRQDSDFYYLTGFEEPNALMVLISSDQPSFYLFVQDKDQEKEIWEGYRAGPEGACQEYGATEGYSIDDVAQQLPKLLAQKQCVYSFIGQRADFDAQLMAGLKQVKAHQRKGWEPPKTFCDLGPILHEMRLIKSPYEQACMRQAASISAQAHRRAMQRCQHLHYEYQLQSEIEYVCSQAGSRRQAYSAIVGGGSNACVLHYVNNDQPLRDGDLVLIDAGAEYLGYAADITRTFPINGRFSPAQKELYELVLAAQEAAISEVRPGVRWNRLHERAVAVLTQGLVDLGLLKGEVNHLIETQAYKRFYMHNTGHWLGMDVHDVGHYKVEGQWRRLQSGMVLTIEPGLYIGAEDDTVEARWRGIGIRIEDDVLVTDDGCEVLTHEVEKQCDQIEALMNPE